MVKKVELRGTYTHTYTLMQIGEEMTACVRLLTVCQLLLRGGAFASWKIAIKGPRKRVIG